MTTTTQQHGLSKWWASSAILLLELLLLYSDYFLLLLYHLIQRWPPFQRLATWLGTTRRYQPARAWLMEGEEVPGRDCLAWELAKYLKMNETMIEETNGARLEALRALQEHLSIVWPWVSIQRSPVDALERMLAWRNYDLCIVDDNWDLAGFLRALNPPSPASWGSLSTVAASPRPAQQQELVARLDLIYSLPQTRISVIQVGASGSERNTTTSATNLNVGARESILCVRLMSASECRLNNVRSSLVFHYSQREPQLAGLYLMVSRLLELAGGLIELSADGLAAEALLRGSSKLGGEQARWRSQEDNEPRARHRLCVTGTGSAQANPSHGSATGELGGQAQPSEDRLSRYALLLMLVAYLNSQSASKLKAMGGRPHQLLARLLADFLAAYANLAPQLRAGHRVVVEPTSSARSMAVRVMAPPPEEEAAGPEHTSLNFQIRDPASAATPEDCTLAGLASRMACHQHAESLINLTDTLTHATFERLLGLMERLSLRALASISQSARSPEELSGSQLELLFMESQQFGERASTGGPSGGPQVSDTLMLNTHTCTLARYAAPGAHQKLNGSIRLGGWEELKGALDCVTLGLAGKITGTTNSDKQNPPKSKRFRRSVAKRLVYLVMFLLLRHEFVARLSQYRSSIETRNRQEWAKLKSSLMGGPNGVGDSLGWQYSAGFGVEAADVEESTGGVGDAVAPDNPEGSWQQLIDEMEEEKKLPATKAEDEIVSVDASSSGQEEPTTPDPNNDLARKEDEEEPAAAASGIDAKEFMGEIMKAMMQQLMESGDLDFGELMQGMDQEGLGGGVPSDWAKNFDPQTISELLKGMKRNGADNPGAEEQEEEDGQEEEEDDDKERADAVSREAPPEATTTLSPNIDSSQTSSDSSESRHEL